MHDGMAGKGGVSMGRKFLSMDMSFGTWQNHRRVERSLCQKQLESGEEEGEFVFHADPGPIRLYIMARQAAL